MWYLVEFCNELCCICIDPGFCCTWNDGNQRSPRFADLKLKSFFIFGEALVVIQNRGISNENTISFYVLFTFFTHTNPLHCVRRVAQRLVGNLQEWKGWTALLLPPAVQVRCGKWVCARGALHREWTRLHSSRVEAVLSGVGRWRPDYQLNFAPTTCCFPYTMFSLTMAASSKTFQISCLSYHSLLPSRNTLDLSFLYHYWENTLCNYFSTKMCFTSQKGIKS